VEVKVENGNVDKALRKLAKKLDKDGLFRDLADRIKYPTVKERRRLKKRRAALKQKYRKTIED